MRVAKFRVSKELMERREEFMKWLPEGTEIINEIDGDLWTMFVVKHDDLPEVATEQGAAVPEISPIIHSKLQSYSLYSLPVYQYGWDWNLK